MKPCRGAQLLSLAVLVIVCCGCVQAATKALSKSECKQIKQSPTFTDNVVEELIKGVSGKIIEYYNWFFRPKSLTGGGKSKSKFPLRELLAYQYTRSRVSYVWPPHQEAEECPHPDYVLDGNRVLDDQVHHVLVDEECGNRTHDSNVECGVYRQ